MVLSQGNKEQNQHYAPRVFTSHYRLVSEWLKNECSKQYPNAQIIIDLLEPYMVVELLIVTNGRIVKPKLYRNLLGFGFYANEPRVDESKDFTCFDFKKADAFKNPSAPTIAELATINAEQNAYSQKLDMVTVGEWDYFLSHPYKAPKKLKKAKCCIKEAGFIHVRPMHIPYVEIRYLKQVPDYFFGYSSLPDDTYVYDPEKSTEELWTPVAIPYLVKGLNLLYANYVREKDYIASAIDLRNNSLF